MPVLTALIIPAFAYILLRRPLEMNPIAIRNWVGNGLPNRSDMGAMAYSPISRLGWSNPELSTCPTAGVHSKVGQAVLSKSRVCCGGGSMCISPQLSSMRRGQLDIALRQSPFGPGTPIIWPEREMFAGA